MSRKYKFHNKEGIYFVSFAVVYWIDVFTRNGYNASFLEILRHYQQEGRLALYAYCVMPSHVHLVFSDREKIPEALIGNIKRFSSQQLQKEIEDNPQESRKEWLLWMMGRAASKSSNVKHRQFWQHHNQPIELWSQDVILQKLNYVHQNPVKAGYVDRPEHWLYSSAVNYGGGKGMIDVELLL